MEREKRIEIVDVQGSKIMKIGEMKTTHQLLIKHPEITAFYSTSALDGIGISQVDSPVMVILPYLSGSQIVQ